MANPPVKQLDFPDDTKETQGDPELTDHSETNELRSQLKRKDDQLEVLKDVVQLLQQTMESAESENNSQREFLRAEAIKKQQMLLLTPRDGSSTMNGQYSNGIDLEQRVRELERQLQEKD